MSFRFIAGRRHFHLAARSHSFPSSTCWLGAPVPRSPVLAYSHVDLVNGGTGPLRRLDEKLADRAAPARCAAAKKRGNFVYKEKRRSEKKKEKKTQKKEGTHIRQTRRFEGQAAITLGDLI